jgi:hypothetical protein
MRIVVVLVLLSGCSTVSGAPQFPECPAPVPVPAPSARIHTPHEIGKLEIRVELARERERKRGDACAAAVDAMKAWMENHR